MVEYCGCMNIEAYTAKLLHGCSFPEFRISLIFLNTTLVLHLPLIVSGKVRDYASDEQTAKVGREDSGVPSWLHSSNRGPGMRPAGALAS
jgi:hypothetical protein